MELLLSAAEKFFEFVALSLYIFFWCAAAGVVTFLLWAVLRGLRQYFEDKREAELLDAWHARNERIAGAVHDLDHPDELQRILAEGYINTLLP